MTNAIPRRISGTVTRHEPYGFYVDFGEEQDGLVVATMVVDDPDCLNPNFLRSTLSLKRFSSAAQTLAANLV